MWHWRNFMTDVYTLTNDWNTFFIDNSTWQKMKIEFFLIDHNRVSGIISTLEEILKSLIMQLKIHKLKIEAWNIVYLL